ncbi:MAG TPA: hypothetical protein VMW43_11155 [Bacteroidota bacterium]|nr:hypothetical protein [Bacteroidota bacterium]
MTMTPTCPKCGGSDFAVSDSGLRNGERKVAIVHCDSCGSAIGLLEVARQDPLPAPRKKGEPVPDNSYQIEL